MNAGNSGGGSSADYAQIISNLGQGASAALQANAAGQGSRKEAKEAKRRTYANLLNQALKRNQGLFRAGQEHSDEMSDYQSQALQQIARGFVESMQGMNG